MNIQHCPISRLLENIFKISREYIDILSLKGKIPPSGLSQVTSRFVPTHHPPSTQSWEKFENVASRVLLDVKCLG